MASPRDYKNTIVPNWCPGCGDYGIQNAISAVCAKKGWADEDITPDFRHRLLLPYRRLSVRYGPTRRMAELFLSHRASNVLTRIST